MTNRRALFCQAYVLACLLLWTTPARSADDGEWRKLTANEQAQTLSQLQTSWEQLFDGMTALAVRYDREVSSSDATSESFPTYIHFNDKPFQHYCSLVESGDDVDAVNPTYAFTLRKKEKAFQLRHLSKTTNAKPTLTIADAADPNLDHATKVILGQHLTCLAGLKASDSFVIPNLLSDPEINIKGVWVNATSGQIKFELENRRPVDLHLKNSRYRSGTFVLDPRVEYQCVRSTSLVQYADGTATGKRQYEYAPFRDFHYASRMTETRTTHQAPQPTYHFIDQYKLVEFSDSGYSVDQCYLAYYGLPEPDFSSRYSLWGRFGTVAFGMILIVVGYLILRQRLRRNA